MAGRSVISAVLRLSRPLLLLLAAITYVLGASVANYLGQPFRAGSFWLGLIAVLMAQLSLSLLSEVFRPPNEPLVSDETPAVRQSLRSLALYISIAALSAAASIAFLLRLNGELSPSGLTFFGVSLLVVLAQALPPFRLLNRGFGEFLLAAHLADVIPSLGFLLQADEYHRLLTLATIPLTALGLAYFIVLDFPAFAADQKYERRNLLTLLGWQRAIPLHHTLIFIAYFLFAAAPFLGLSLQLIWPVFMPLPFAILQMLTLRNIAQGAPPNWTLLTVNALAVFVLTAYFLTLTFWLR